jgi:hypothetical protein
MGVTLLVSKALSVDLVAHRKKLSLYKDIMYVHYNRLWFFLHADAMLMTHVWGKPSSGFIQCHVEYVMFIGSYITLVL